MNAVGIAIALRTGSVRRTLLYMRKCLTRLFIEAASSHIQINPSTNQEKPLPMKFNNHLRFTVLLAALLVFAGTAAAQSGPVIDVGTTNSQLEMSAEVQTALQLNISTGTGGATVSGDNATGLFTIDFGVVNGLGLGTPSAGVVVVADATGALYKTPINLTPVYSGFAGETAAVTVIGGASGDEDLALEGSSSISSASTVTGSHGAFSGAASGSANERFVGFYIPRSEVAGDKTATLIYTVTMNLD